MRTVKRTRAAIAAAALATVALAAPASAGLLPSGGALAPVQPWLSQQLVGLDAATPSTAPTWPRPRTLSPPPGCGR